MRITIIGVGAMGSLFAARLSPLANVTMIGNWPAQLDIINSAGISLIHPDGRQTRHKVKATNNPLAVESTDLALILVKTPYTAVAAKTAAAVLEQNGLALTLQNGLGNLAAIAGFVGPDRAAQGVTSEGASMAAPGIVRHAGAGQTYLAESKIGGQPAGENRAARLQAAVDLFNEAGFETELVDNADSLIWGKVAVNAGINPLTALLQRPNGFLLENKDAFWLMALAAAEAAAVAAALGISLPFPDSVERTVQVAQATAGNFSSMAQDVARGVQTEIEAICGSITQYGRQLGIPTPINESLYNLILSQTMTGNWQALINAQPLAIGQRLLRLAAGQSATGE